MKRALLFPRNTILRRIHRHASFSTLFHYAVTDSRTRVSEYANPPAINYLMPSYSREEPSAPADLTPQPLGTAGIPAAPQGIQVETIPNIQAAPSGQPPAAIPAAVVQQSQTSRWQLPALLRRWQERVFPQTRTPSLQRATTETPAVPPPAAPSLLGSVVPPQPPSQPSLPARPAGAVEQGAGVAVSLPPPSVKPIPPTPASAQEAEDLNWRRLQTIMRKHEEKERAEKENSLAAPAQSTSQEGGPSPAPAEPTPGQISRKPAVPDQAPKKGATIIEMPSQAPEAVMQTSREQSSAATTPGAPAQPARPSAAAEVSKQAEESSAPLLTSTLPQAVPETPGAPIPAGAQPLTEIMRKPKEKQANAPVIPTPETGPAFSPKAVVSEQLAVPPEEKLVATPSLPTSPVIVQRDSAVTEKVPRPAEAELPIPGEQNVPSPILPQVPAEAPISPISPPLPAIQRKPDEVQVTVKDTSAAVPEQEAERAANEVSVPAAAQTIAKSPVPIAPPPPPAAPVDTTSAAGKAPLAPAPSRPIARGEPSRMFPSSTPTPAASIPVIKARLASPLIPGVETAAVTSPLRVVQALPEMPGKPAPAVTPAAEDQNWRRLQTIMRKHEEKDLAEKARAAASQAQEAALAAPPAIEVERLPVFRPDQPSETVQEQPLPLEAVWPVRHNEFQTQAVEKPAAPLEAATPLLATPAAISEKEEGMLRQVVQRAKTGQPTSSHVELILPRGRRPEATAPANPAVRSETANRAPEGTTLMPPSLSPNQPLAESIQRQPESGTAIPPSRTAEGGAGEGIVQTDIGPLPGDLWNLLGQQPPAQPSAVKQTTAGNVQRAPLDQTMVAPTRLHSLPIQPVGESTVQRAEEPPAQQNAVPSQAPSEGAGGETPALSDEDLDKLAQQVYTNIRQKISIEQERNRR